MMKRVGCSEGEDKLSVSINTVVDKRQTRVNSDRLWHLTGQEKGEEFRAWV